MAKRGRKSKAEKAAIEAEKLKGAAEPLEPINTKSTDSPIIEEEIKRIQPSEMNLIPFSQPVHDDTITLTRGALHDICHAITELGKKTGTKFTAVENIKARLNG